MCRVVFPQISAAACMGHRVSPDPWGRHDTAPILRRRFRYHPHHAAERHPMHRASDRADAAPVLRPGRWRSWAIPLLIALPAMIWTDRRFSVHVSDDRGYPVGVDTKQIQMQASFFGATTLHYGHGNRLKKGVVYFGFCQWVRHRENGMFGETRFHPKVSHSVRKKSEAKPTGESGRCASLWTQSPHSALGLGSEPCPRRAATLSESTTQWTPRPAIFCRAL